MKTTRSVLAVAGIAMAIAGGAQAGDGYYEVTVTNLTKGQIFSPIVAASHNAQFNLYTLGEPASAALAAVAQDADYSGITALLQASSDVNGMAMGSGVILPGHSDTVMLPAMEKSDRISLAAMLVTTNDAFIGLAGAMARAESMTNALVPALDAGSEANSESCMHIPGPPCGHAFMAPDMAAEGFIHVHNGIHGVGDLDASDYDWRNPVAKISVKHITK